MYNEIILRFTLAILWGGIIGSERQYRSKSAGFRTMIMISLGACFFTIISKVIGGEVNGDRIASNIVSGIGFIGAGVIFKGDNRVNGITTAATIWVVAAVGMGIGAGYYFAAGCCSVFIILILSILPFIEKHIDELNQLKDYSISTLYEKNSITQIEQIFNEIGVKFRLIKINKIGKMVDFEWEIQAHKKKHIQLAESLMNNNLIIELKN
jgi:putative Mg2+ transporter-C (MgtC) family protein